MERLTEKRIPPKILVVDDESDLLHTVVEFLSGAGFDVLGTQSAVQALEQVALFRPNLIITDIRMPLLDGLQLMQTIQLQAPRTGYPVPAFIFISGDNGGETARAIANLKNGQIVLKPFKLEDLAAKCWKSYLEK